MTLENKLYDLINSIDMDNVNGLGFSVHEANSVDCYFPEDSNGYRIYHKDGYCFEITFERQYDEDNNEIEPFYQYHDGEFDGFKTLPIEKAIEIIENEGVFL